MDKQIQLERLKAILLGLVKETNLKTELSVKYQNGLAYESIPTLKDWHDYLKER